MQIVIDLPDKLYEGIINHSNARWVDADLVRNGTPLPKGHGDLIDKDRIQRIDLWDHFAHLTYRNKFNPLLPVKYTLEAPTIIPADKEAKNADSN